MQEKFDLITLEISKKIIASGQGEDFVANDLFYTGKHWQGGDGWVGPSYPATSTLYTEYMTNLEKRFVFVNAFKEIANRHIAGFLGVAPQTPISLSRKLEEEETPTATEQALIDEASDLWSAWWKHHSASDDDFLNEAARIIQLGEHAVLRIVIPQVLIESGLITRMEPQEAIKHIHIAVHDELAANVWTYPFSFADVAVYVSKKGDGVFEEFGVEVAELCYLADDGVTTILRTTDGDTINLDLGGVLTMYKVSRTVNFGAAMRSLQKQLNKAWTIWGRNTDTAGFRERTILNATEPPNMKVGPGVVNFIDGLTYTDVDGSIKIASPSMVYGDPVPVESFVATTDALYARMLHEAHQTHAILSGDGAVSEASRIQAQGEFEADLNESADAINSALDWAFQAVMGMAAVLAGTPGKYAELQCVAQCIVEPSPMAVDERRFWLDASEKRKVSNQTMQIKVGIRDPEAEAVQIATEDKAAQEIAMQNQQEMIALMPVDGDDGEDSAKKNGEPTGNGNPFKKTLPFGNGKR